MASVLASAPAGVLAIVSAYSFFSVPCAAPTDNTNWSGFSLAPAPARPRLLAWRHPGSGPGAGQHTRNRLCGRTRRRHHRLACQKSQLQRPHPDGGSSAPQRASGGTRQGPASRAEFSRLIASVRYRIETISTNSSNTSRSRRCAPVLPGIWLPARFTRCRATPL